jgi:hypothetical protein
VKKFFAKHIALYRLTSKDGEIEQLKKELSSPAIDSAPPVKSRGRRTSPGKAPVSRQLSAREYLEEQLQKKKARAAELEPWVR